MAATTARPKVGEMIRVRDVVTDLGVSRGFVYSQIIPNVKTVKVGARVLIDAVSLRGWLAARTTDPSGGGAQ